MTRLMTIWLITACLSLMLCGATGSKSSTISLFPEVHMRHSQPGIHPSLNLFSIDGFLCLLSLMNRREQDQGSIYEGQGTNLGDVFLFLLCVDVSKSLPFMLIEP